MIGLVTSCQLPHTDREGLGFSCCAKYLSEQDLCMSETTSEMLAFWSSTYQATVVVLRLVVSILSS